MHKMVKTCILYPSTAFIHDGSILIQRFPSVDVYTGVDPGFSFGGGGGGGRKRLCARTHITSAEPNSLLAGVQGPLKGPGSSGVVLMLSRAI